MKIAVGVNKKFTMEAKTEQIVLKIVVVDGVDKVDKVDEFDEIDKHRRIVLS